MSDEYTDYELEFFQAIDRNTLAEQAIFDALMSIRDDQYYTIFEIEAEHTCGWARLQVFPERAGTLYRSIQRMVEQDLIEETAARPAPELDDERRRYYRITTFGREVALAETERLQAMVCIARASGVAARRA